MGALDILDLAGVFVFALSGGLIARRQNLDVVGVFALGIVTAFAGGVFRDVLLDDLPPQALLDSRYLFVALAAASAVLIAPRLMQKLQRPALVFDAAGLGLYATVGAARAIEAGLGPLPTLLIGVIAATGGGILRDLLAGRPPEIFGQGSRLYAVPAGLGASIVAVCDHLGVASSWAQVVAISAAFTLRMLALRYNWRTPIPVKGLPQLEPPTKK